MAARCCIGRRRIAAASALPPGLCTANTPARAAGACARASRGSRLRGGGPGTRRPGARSRRRPPGRPPAPGWPRSRLPPSSPLCPVVLAASFVLRDPWRRSLILRQNAERKAGRRAGSRARGLQRAARVRRIAWRRSCVFCVVGDCGRAPAPLHGLVVQAVHGWRGRRSGIAGRGRGGANGREALCYQRAHWTAASLYPAARRPPALSLHVGAGVLTLGACVAAGRQHRRPAVRHRAPGAEHHDACWLPVSASAPEMLVVPRSALPGCKVGERRAPFCHDPEGLRSLS